MGNSHLEPFYFLLGEWKISGVDEKTQTEIMGIMTNELMEGGHFLIQKVSVHFPEKLINSIEYLTYHKQKGVYYSYYFDNHGSIMNSLWTQDDYVYRVFQGGLHSESVFTGLISEDQDVIEGVWTWPNGSNRVVITRIKKRESM